MANPLNAAVSNSVSGVGPAEFPSGAQTSQTKTSPGNVFGDKSPRTPASAGGSLAMGLACCENFHNQTPDMLGEGRNASTGKPTGPQKGPVNNGGASAKPAWG